MKRVFLACSAALLVLAAACDTPNDPRLEATDGFGTNSLDVRLIDQTSFAGGSS